MMNPALSTFLKYMGMLIPLPNLNPNLTYSTYFELYFEVQYVRAHPYEEGRASARQYITRFAHNVKYISINYNVMFSVKL